jgi:DNA-binding CsgD family transcriptional regulator
VVLEVVEWKSSVSDAGMLDGLVEDFLQGFLRDDARLQSALVTLSRQLGAENGQLAIRQGPSGSPLLRYIHGIPDDYRLINSYDSEHCAQDPFLALLWLPENLGRLFWTDLQEQDGGEAAAFFDAYRKSGWRYMLSGAFYNKDGRLGYVRFLRAGSAGPFDRDRAAALPYILPHLAMAYGMREAFSQVYAALEPHLLQGGEEDMGIVYLDAERRSVLLNDQARRIFAAMDGLYHRSGTVAADGWEETQAIGKLITHAIASARDPHNLPSRSEVTIARPSGRAPYALQAVPVIVRNRFTDENGIVAALRIVDQEEQDLSATSQAYRLTAAETRLAHYLISGMPPKEVARQTGLSIHTIRTQQRGLYRKLGVSRHFDLLMRLAPNRVK